MSLARQSSGESQPVSLFRQASFKINGSRALYIVAVLAVATLYFAAAKFGLSLASVHTNVSPVWPPTGIALAAMLLFGIRVWPGIFLGALAANLMTPVPAATAFGIAFGNTLESIVATGALNVFGFRNSFDRARDVFKFVATAAICTMISATIGNLSLYLGHAASGSAFRSLWMTWWLGDLTGAVTVTPLILTWATGGEHWLPRRRYLEASALILLLSVSAIFTFGETSASSVHYYPLSRLMVPFLLWAAFRVGRRGVTVAIAVVSAFAIWGTAHGFGPFISDTANQSLLMLQVFIATNAVTFLFLVTVVEEKRLTEESRRQDQRRLKANLAVTRILAESPEASVALPRILATIGETLGWEFGCAWVPASDGKVLRSAATWQPREKAPRFEALSRERTFAPGIGLPGRIWTTLKPAWIQDVAKDDNFPRGPIAAAEGLHGAFGFPIMFKDKFVGVMEFFSSQIRQPDELLLAMFAGIGSQIGQFIERKRAEAAVESASLLPKENPAPVIRVTHEGIVAFANPGAEPVLRAWKVGIGKTVPEDIAGKVREVFVNATREAIGLSVGDRVYSIQLAPITSADYVNLYFTDITDQRSIERSLAEIARQQSALFAFADKVQHAPSLAAIYDAGLDAIVAALQCDRASILLYDNQQVMRFVVWRGLSDGYRKAVEGHSPWRPGDPNPQPVTIADVETALDEELKRTIVSEGIRAAAFIPLIASGELIGEFMTYYDQPHEFSAAEINLGLTLARQLATGIDSKRAAEALRENESRLRLATTTGKVGVWDWDIVANRISWTHSLYEIHGISKEEFPETVEAFAALVHPEDRERVQAAIDNSLRNDAPYQLEMRTVRPDGEIVWIYTNATVLRENAKPVRMLGATVDISELKRAEITLRESQERHTRLIDSAMDAVITVDHDQRIVIFNAAAERMFGCESAKAIGQLIDRFIPESLRAAHRKHIRSFGDGGVTRRSMGALGALSAVRANGEEFPIEASISQTEVKGQKLYTVILRDITERRRTEKALRHMAAIVETTDDAVISKNLDGMITSWNPAAERLYGYKAEEVIGKPVTILIPPERPDEEPAILARLRRGERIDHYETIRVAKDGRKLHVSLTVSPIRDADGKIIGASKIARDITLQKQHQDEIARLLAAERAARQDAEVASRTKDEFLATLSHELRTPLTAMLGWLTILRAHKLDKKTAKHAIETIERNAKAQAQLIEDLVDISRIVGGKLNLEVLPTELLPVINAAVEVVRPAADAKEITIEVNYDATVGPVSGDAGRLQQVIWNLLSNAVKFTPKGGSVFVDFHRTGTFAEFLVRDTGIGISPDFLPHVFERFRQGESSTTRSHRGMGLGLAIVRHLVELHGGTISAASDGENRGASFAIRLPLASASKVDTAITTPQKTNHENRQELEGLRVLLVEDEPDARELIVMLLKDSGAHVEAVDTATGALQRLPLFIPDVLVSDIGLPRESGYDLIRKVRALTSEVNKVPAIALTAFATDNDRKESLSAGFQAHLAKPVEPSDLFETIKFVLNGKN